MRQSARGSGEGQCDGRRSGRAARLAFASPFTYDDLMSHSARLLAALVLLSACHGGQKPEESSPAEQPIRLLAQLAAQRTILTPTYYGAAGDGRRWIAGNPRTRGISP